MQQPTCDIQGVATRALTQVHNSMLTCYSTCFVFFVCAHRALAASPENPENKF